MNVKVRKVNINGNASFGMNGVTRAWQDRAAFNANGTLQGSVYEIGKCYATMGQLNDTERKRFYADMPNIVFMVKSYATPVAWVLANGDEYKVSQRFSVTTSKHMGRIY